MSSALFLGSALPKTQNPKLPCGFRRGIVQILQFEIRLKKRALGPIETLGNLWCSIQRDERSGTRSTLELTWKGEE